MAKTKADRTEYVCTECGANSPKWAGQCTECKAWNTLTEFREAKAGGVTRVRRVGYAGADTAGVQKLTDIELSESPRQLTQLSELDRVLGGGLVPGSVILIGGDPGIGKSTLLLQVMAKLSQSISSLYVSGEESLQQIALRARRLGLDVAALGCLTETSIDRLLDTAAKEQPAALVVDSIQTIYTDQLQSAPGSVAQVRETAAALVRFAKTTRTTVFLVGHVTKEGGIAGPRVLEHMVDGVLYFEGDPSSRYRVIRALKNRFGAANELGVFAMTDNGLKPVSSPSAIFLSGHSGAPGSQVLVTREGTRPLLVELQALLAQSSLGNPRRVALGVDGNRLAMLLAVLQRQAGIMVGDQDVFVNAVGGMRINETAADLPLLMAVTSSLRDRAIAKGTVAFGEIGLAGEVRPITHGDERLREAVKHGFDRAIVPMANVPKKPIDGLSVIGVDRVNEALELID